MARPAKIRRVSAAEAVERHLVERIREGEFGPGDLLPSERQLKDELGVGRLSLREGLARMSALGIIQVDHGKGARVREGIDCEAFAGAMVTLFPERSAKALTDLLEARQLIEVEVTGLAATKRNDDDCVRLRAILEEPGEALEDDQAMADLDFAFHREIARIADNDFLCVMLDALSQHIRSYLLHYARSQRAHPQRAIDRHRPILEAIEEGDVEAAQAAAAAHINDCRESVATFVGRERPTGAYRDLE